MTFSYAVITQLSIHSIFSYYLIPTQNEGNSLPFSHCHFMGSLRYFDSKNCLLQYKYSQGALCLSYYQLIMYVCLCMCIYTNIKHYIYILLMVIYIFYYHKKNKGKFSDNTNWTFTYMLLFWKGTLLLSDFLRLTFISMSSKDIHFLNRLLWIVEYVLGYTVSVY